ncbi:hypothetical protein [Fundidesulfovibrio agrisoli]|uniref:hypothetical protein n=1 Tax=Fundidesulfovibrio agrisoli TaxID=2922717 RepID=UPI001FAC4007|nr:hypothetical protein [Fundidesulfovibrio agrisoli]
MAKDTTPMQWPMEQSGLLDDLWAALAGTAPVRKILGHMRGGGGAARPAGGMRVALAGGQSAVLTGGARLRVDCLQGRALVACPARSSGEVLGPGESLCMEAGVSVSVTALDSPSELSFGWR